MTTTNAKNVAALQHDLGVTAESVKRKPKKETYLAATSGKLSCYLSSTAWPNKDDPSIFDEPSFDCYCTVQGYNNSNGYSIQVPIDSNVVALENMEKFFRSLKEFVIKSGIDLSKSGFVKDDLSAALDLAAQINKKKA